MFVVVIVLYHLPASINFKLSVLKFSRCIDLGVGGTMCVESQTGSWCLLSDQYSLLVGEVGVLLCRVAGCVRESSVLWLPAARKP